MNWKDEQEKFWAWINRPQDLSGSAEQIASMFAPHSHISQAAALSIYNNAYHQRLVEVSSALFPVLFNTLGRELYTQLWIAYMSVHPPRNGPIHRVGEHLHSYVQAHPKFNALPAVADIVQLESLLTELFDKQDEVPYTLADLQSLAPETWPGMRWQAKQDWALFYSAFDLEKYWRQMQGFIASGQEPGSSDFAIAPLAQARPDTPNYLVLRVQQRMQFQSIRPELATFLQGILQKQDFAQICTVLATDYPEHDIPALSLKLLLRAIDLELLCATRSQTLS